MLKKFSQVFISISLLFLVACQPTGEQENVIKIGTISGPETVLMEVAKEVAQKEYGLTIKIVPFSDYILPNQALSDSSIDANMFQHKPYLDKATSAKGYKFTVIGKTFVYPMGLYSKKHKYLRDIPDGAVIAIPNDPSNEARSLLLLQKAGFINLKNSGDAHSTTLSIVDNPKKLTFKEIDAAQLPRVLQDVDLAAINTNYALLSDSLSKQDALYYEDDSSLYANIVVVRTASKDRDEFKKLMSALHSEAVQAKAKALFKGKAIKAW